MKFKKDTSNVKSVNKSSPSSPSHSSSESVATNQILLQKSPKDSHQTTSPNGDRKPDDCHQKIVKRLMSHSQYYPTSVVKSEGNISPPNQNNIATSYHQAAPYTISHYPATAYNYHHQIYNNNNDNNNVMMNDYYQKDNSFGSYAQQQNSFAYNTCLTTLPPLGTPPSSTLQNFDQISNCSPSSSDYIFNGDFSVNFNGTDFDAASYSSFPLIDGKSSQFFDNNQTLDIKQLSPIKIQSYDDDEKKCYTEELNGGQSIQLPSVAFNWKFSEPQMTASY